MVNVASISRKEKQLYIVKQLCIQNWMQSREKIIPGDFIQFKGQKQYVFDGLNRYHLWAYGMGHALNDLTATCWFNYLFFFLKKVLVVKSAASAILWGQVLDGLATPLIGYYSDKCTTSIGQRKPWYIAGILLVFFSTVLLFSGYKSSDSSYEGTFYISMALTYCGGFACLQISHMSLVPSLTCSRKRRDRLNNLRNSFTFISNFVVLGFGLVIFSTMSDKLLQYKLIADFAAILGLGTSIFFVLAINEPSLAQATKDRQANLQKILEELKKNSGSIVTQTKYDQFLHTPQPFIELQPSSQNIQIVKQSQLTQSSTNLLHWFKLPRFYLYGICYISARMYINMFGTLMPFYITDVLKMVDWSSEQISYNLALIPMMVYISSVAVSLKLNRFYQIFGRKKALLIGTTICLICASIMTQINDQNAVCFYALAIMIGISQSLVLSTATNLISDVIGSKAEKGAFVFGIYSMFDRIAVGLGIYLVGETQSYSREPGLASEADTNFIKWTVILIPSACCLLSSSILCMTSVQEYTYSQKPFDNHTVSRLQSQLVC